MAKERLQRGNPSNLWIYLEERFFFINRSEITQKFKIEYLYSLIQSGRFFKVIQILRILNVQSGETTKKFVAHALTVTPNIYPKGFFFYYSKAV